MRVEGRYRNGNIFVDWEGLSKGGRRMGRMVHVREGHCGRESR